MATAQRVLRLGRASRRRSARLQPRNRRVVRLGDPPRSEHPLQPSWSIRPRGLMAVHRLTTTLNSGATRCEVKPALERSRPVSSQDSEQAIVEFWGLFRAKSGIDGPRKRSAGGILSFHML